MNEELQTVAAGGSTVIKSDGKSFVLFVNGNEVERAGDYNVVARLATDIYVSRAAHSGDDLIGKKMFAPSNTDTNGTVVVVAKTANGYVVQKAGTSQRFEILPEYLSEIPTQYFQ